MKFLSASSALVIASVTMALSGPAVQAGDTYYRWQDQNGRPVHSDRPPPKGVDYEVVSTGSRLKRSVDSSEGAVPRSVEPTPGDPFKPVELTKVKIEKNPEYCARAKENLAALNGEVRIRMRDENGEIYFLSEEDREYQRKRAMDTVKAHCE